MNAQDIEMLDDLQDTLGLPLGLPPIVTNTPLEDTANNILAYMRDNPRLRGDRQWQMRLSDIVNSCPNLSRRQRDTFLNNIYSAFDAGEPDDETRNAVMNYSGGFAPTDEDVSVMNLLDGPARYVYARLRVTRNRAGDNPNMREMVRVGLNQQEILAQAFVNNPGWMDDERAGGNETRIAINRTQAFMHASSGTVVENARNTARRRLSETQVNSAIRSERGIRVRRILQNEQEETNLGPLYEVNNIGGEIERPPRDIDITGFNLFDAMNPTADNIHFTITLTAEQAQGSPFIAGDTVIQGGRRFFVTSAIYEFNSASLMTDIRVTARHERFQDHIYPGPASIRNFAPRSSVMEFYDELNRTSDNYRVNIFQRLSQYRPRQAMQPGNILSLRIAVLNEDFRNLGTRLNPGSTIGLGDGNNYSILEFLHERNIMTNDYDVHLRLTMLQTGVDLSGGPDITTVSVSGGGGGGGSGYEGAQGTGLGGRSLGPNTLQYYEAQGFKETANPVNDLQRMFADKEIRKANNEKAALLTNAPADALFWVTIDTEFLQHAALAGKRFIMSAQMEKKQTNTGQYYQSWFMKPELKLDRELISNSLSLKVGAPGLISIRAAKEITICPPDEYKRAVRIQNSRQIDLED